LQRRGVQVTVSDQYCIMRAGITRAGSSCISVQADKGEPLGPCKIEDLPPRVVGGDFEDMIEAAEDSRRETS
jgi:hypothetical protein